MTIISDTNMSLTKITSQNTKSENAPLLLRVRGAREHNLRNISIDLPRNQLVVITGLSGSGKSSLAFDTIYAEGQRRYVESLSAYARQFLQLMPKPDVDSIEGLSPAISIEQKTTSKNPRSTVGTVTEIYDYMRLLWARIGIPYSPATGLPIESQTISQMVDRVMTLPEATRFYLFAPIVRDRKGEYRKELEDLIKRGFLRVRIDGDLIELDATNIPHLNKKRKHHIEVVVDRLVIRSGLETRLADSLETALELANGIAFIEIVQTNDEAEPGNNKNSNPKQITFSAKFACPVSGFTLDEIEPRLFSFNSPQGACPVCDGLGTQAFFDPDLIVPDIQKSLYDGAIFPWSKTSAPAPYYMQTLESVCNHLKANIQSPWADLTEPVQQAILYGTGTDIVTIRYHDETREYTTKKPFEGVIPNLERRLRKTESNWIREDLGRFQNVRSCDACKGQRLRPEALAVKIGSETLSTITNLSIGAALTWFSSLPEKLTEKQNTIAQRILQEIFDRLTFLDNVGLNYLTLSRTSATLSGGESQRIRLASQIGSGLTGVLYVLDEPSIGLHQRDNERLLVTLRRLRDLGNTVIVVEHDEDAIRSADYLVDMGPLAGIHGGNVVAMGPPSAVMACPESLTGQYLTGARSIPLLAQRRSSTRMLRVVGARANNLANVTAEIPLGTLTCITGVSGGGKSTLIIETLYRALARRLHNARTHPGDHDHIEGVEYIDKVIDINQSPIGRTPRSNPATYIGAFTSIRDWFAGLPEAKTRGYSAGRFSFNVKGGRCEACQGDGMIKIEMNFLPDIFVQCDICKGTRYNRETQEIRFRDRSIADVLALTVDEGADLFKAVPAIHDKMAVLQQVGLGYVKVGQSATTLSGGEAQRVKLAKELARRATGQTLYILDEPTTGLHFEDIRKLLDVLQRLVEQGNSVLVIEHNLEVIKTADWILDLGPEGGNGGGRIIATGTPEQICEQKESYTGHYLKSCLMNATYLAPTIQPSIIKPVANKAKRKSASKAKRKSISSTNTEITVPEDGINIEENT